MQADTTITKAEALAKLRSAHRKLDSWRNERGLTNARALNVAASGAGVGIGAAIEGFFDGRGYKPPLPVAVLVGAGLSALALTDHVADDVKDPVLLLGTNCMAVPVAQKVYGSVHQWAAKGAQTQAAPAQVAGHVGYAPPQLHAPMPLAAYGHHQPAAPYAAALPSSAAQADALARQLYALAS